MKYRPVPPFLQIRQFVQAIAEYGFWGAVVDFWKRLFRSIRDRGFIGTLRRVSPNRRPPQVEMASKGPHPFDLLHGTDTSGHITGTRLSANSLSAMYITGYAGIPPSALTQAISALQIDFEQFTFVDIGCGKGRALLVASQFPFGRLLGLEIASELCDIARTNIARRHDWAARISIVEQDAAAFTFPEGPLVLYLYDPFRAPQLRRFLKNLERQLMRSPRSVYLLYGWDPHHSEVMNSFDFLKLSSEISYNLSAEDVAHDIWGRTEERFSVYYALDLAG